MSFGNNYMEFLNYLGSRGERRIVFGLERVLEALDRLDHPERAFKSVHIAGTNGKGSTAVFIEAILRKSGLKVGLYTSPHLVDVRERISIDRNPISEEDAGMMYKMVMDKCHDLELTYFELLTIMAFLCFREAGVDFAVVETGLGGRLDATNIISPEVSVLTKISLDHEDLLGSDISSIAQEKCGIIKKGIPVVSSPQVEVVAKVIKETAEKMDAPLFFAKELPPDIGKISLKGTYQLENAATAVLAARTLESRGYINKIPPSPFQDVVWRGRLERLYYLPEIIVDGAHNPDACLSLAKYISEEFPFREKIIVFGAMRDKNIREMISILSNLTNHWILFDLGGERAASPREIARLGSLTNFCTASSEEEAIGKAADFGFKNPLILVTGSLYLVGRFIKWKMERRDCIS